MHKYLQYLLAALLFGLTVTEVSAQDIVYDSVYVQSVRDSVERYYEKHPWKRPKAAGASRTQTLPVYGVMYSPEREFTAMGGFMMSYPTSGDTGLPLSQIGAVASISTNLSVSGNITGANYAAGGHFHTTYSVKYYRSPWRFWGLGYEAASEDTNRSTFLENRIRSRVDLLYRNGSKLRAGIFLGYDFYRAEQFSSPALIEGHPTATSYFTAGLRLDFDTRDQVVQPGRGVFLEVEPSVNIPTTGPASDIFYRVQFTADFYFSLWWGAVLALDFYGDLASQTSPWTMWNETGGDVRMRGYYTGRYRDRNFVSAQAELRQTVYRSHGIAVWGGAGNVFPSFREFNIRHTLPTYGIGYRYTLLGLITFRLDAGFGRGGEYGIYAGINQAF